MREILNRWISDADALRHLEYFKLVQPSLELAHIRARAADYYTALVGELFEMMRLENGESSEWARLGNALAHFGMQQDDLFPQNTGVSGPEAALFSSSAFYFGGFPASAYLTMGTVNPEILANDASKACFDLLRRPSAMSSQRGATLLDALRRGDRALITGTMNSATAAAAEALPTGPDEWIPARLFERLMKRFAATNLRAVLPDGDSEFWTPLISSLVGRNPPTWEFFPSQIEAIQRGLIQRNESFSLQMPTGAGKTTLCETLLYGHVRSHENSVAVMLVPYRALAAELRESLVKRLNGLGISSRCAYGGTVPSSDEVDNLDSVRVLVATPEALAGVMSADGGFFRRITLVICDEGHLLDGGERGVALELLLARMMVRTGGGPRLVFVSAIVPNIEEINSWLGGTADSVVRSQYRPALAEFAVLRPSGKGASFSVQLEMHPHEKSPIRFAISPFLRRADFQWVNQVTGRLNTYNFQSIKTQAIATARKALPMGTAAVFAANKRGNQGAVGLAEELVSQLNVQLNLPLPGTYIRGQEVEEAAAYLRDEYGGGWVGTQTLLIGAILHHGDIPQETREVLEFLLRGKHIRLVICTSTLAEGVNLPIRTLVLYSVQRRRPDGRSENLLTRDIKNLVGRAGRAGATTKGLVVCANKDQWPQVQEVARQAQGEPVIGALRQLVERVTIALARGNPDLTNQRLEASLPLYTLIDGIDATLIDLASEELGEDALVRMARDLADQTFASRQATQESSREVLRQVFALRANRVIGVRSSGRLGWIQETGARMRMIDPVETGLLPLRERWDDVTNPTDAEVVNSILTWAWSQRELQAAIRDAYRLAQNADLGGLREPFFALVTSWLAGRPFHEIAARAALTVDDLLSVHTHVVTFVLQTLIEQAIALLEKLLAAQGVTLSRAVAQFPDHLRFGVPTESGVLFAAKGVKHRRAVVALGAAIPAPQGIILDPRRFFADAREILQTQAADWEAGLGGLVYRNTLRDLA